MSYMQELDVWLTEALRGLPADELKRVLKHKILESYRNGQKACPKCSKDAGHRDGR